MSIISRINNFYKDYTYGIKNRADEIMKQCTKRERKGMLISDYVDSGLFVAAGCAILTLATKTKSPILFGLGFCLGAPVIGHGINYAIQSTKSYNEYKDKPEGKGFMG